MFLLSHTHSCVKALRRQSKGASSGKYYLSHQAQQGCVQHTHGTQHQVFYLEKGALRKIHSLGSLCSLLVTLEWPSLLPHMYFQRLTKSSSLTQRCCQTASTISFDTVCFAARRSWPFVKLNNNPRVSSRESIKAAGTLAGKLLQSWSYYGSKTRKHVGPFLRILHGSLNHPHCLSFPYSS